MHYTKQLRRIIEQESQYEPNLTRKQRIEIGRQAFFGGMEYPIFDEKYRAVFETHFIRHFYMKEIGFETDGLFQFQLETWLQINMPYFNQLFKSAEIEFDPFINTKINVTSQKKSDQTKDRDETGKQTQSGSYQQSGTGNQTSKSTQSGATNADTFNREIMSDTPQDRLAITTQDGKGVIQYATEITENTGKTNGTSSGTTSASGNTEDQQSGSNSQNQNLENKSKEVGNELEDYVYQKIGKIGNTSYPELLEQYRKSFIRIEQMIFKECNQLFMLIY